MAELGFRTINEMVGRPEFLKVREGITHWKARHLDLSGMLHPAANISGGTLYQSEAQDHGLDNILDWQLLEHAQPALNEQTPVYGEFEVHNTDRTIGTLLSNEIAKRYHAAGLPDNTINYRFHGSAGQSFGAFSVRGLAFTLEGEANDYVGKGLSGAQLAIFPDAAATFVPENNILIGNVALYGATSGALFVRGQAGERFAVRNSGATAVVEGVGDHGCEYMTGGTVVVLGQAGRNFAAGMSGGIAYVLDEAGDFRKRCNLAMVELEAVPAEAAHVQHAGDMAGELESHGRVNVNHLDQSDRTILCTLIQRHLHYTGSERARAILGDLDRYLPKFVKIMPTEYRRALAEMAAAHAPAEKVKHG